MDSPPPTKRQINAPQPINNRSAVSNGTKLFVEGDGRTPWARRFRDICDDLTASQGGHSEELSEPRKILTRQAAALVVECEQMAGAASEGATFDINRFTTALNTIHRVLQTLGIDRKQVAMDGLSQLIDVGVPINGEAA